MKFLRDKELWREAITLPELIVKLVDSGQKESGQFQDIIKWHGLDKVRRLYREQKEKVKKESHNEPKEP